MLAVKSNVLKKHGITLMIVIHYLVSRLCNKVENVGHLFFHLTIYRRRTGFIEVGVDDSKADGRVRFTVVDDYRQTHFQEINFRIFNRWLVRNKRRCSNNLLWQIKTDLMSLEGLNVHSIVWGREPHRTRELKPFDMSRLPDERIIAERNARLKKFQDWMARHFPSREISLGMSPHASANDIVFQWRRGSRPSDSMKPLLPLPPDPLLKRSINGQLAQSARIVDPVA